MDINQARGNVSPLSINYLKHRPISCLEEQSAIPFIAYEENLVADNNHCPARNQAVADHCTIGDDQIHIYQPPKSCNSRN